MPGNQYAASLLRAHTTGLKTLGIYAEVLAQAPPRLRTLLEHPPLPTVWLGLEPLGDLWAVVDSMGGLELIERVSLAGTQQTTGRLLTPLARTMFTLFGASPETLFSRLPSFIGVVVRGMEMSWSRTEGAAPAGVLEMTAAEPHLPREWAAWTGALRWIFDLASTPGTIVVNELSAEGRVARFGVAWTPKA